MQTWLVKLLILLWLPLAGGATELISEEVWNQSAPAKPDVAVTATRTAAPVAGPSLAVLAGGLCLVIGLAVALGWAAKRLGMRRLVQGRGQHLTVVETVPIGFKRQAALVRFGDQVVLVGLGEHECCHLGTFPASALGAQPQPAPAAPPAPAAFAGILARVGGGTRP